MRKFTVLFIALLLIMQVHSQASFFAKDFAAEFAMVSTFEGVVVTTDIHLYASAEAIRSDIFMEGERISYSIVHYEGDELISYGILPATKQMMVIRGAELEELLGESYAFINNSGSDVGSMDMAANCAAEGFVCEEVGSEILLGRATTKWIMEDLPEVGTVTIWLDEELRYPLQMQSDTMSMTLTSIDVEPQAASLFEIPEGYQELELPAGLDLGF